ncbi:hypothetical protein [Hymenobacter sp. B81]|uniref:hypothetical protein n=1 Tax=Hymenobacter sp. B81 TaxID=3344878 RepID=UPI0037DD8178
MRRLLWPLVQLAVALGLFTLALRWLLALFGRRRVVFEVGYWRGVYLLAWPLACLAVGLPFLLSFLTDPHPPWEGGLLLGLGGVVMGFSLPAFLLHGQYYLRNRHTAVLFDPRQNRLEVYERGRPVPFAHADVARVDWVRCRSPRLFWSPYNYLRLYLHDGRVITLTSLLTELEPVAEFLRHMALTTRRRWFCWA